MNGPLEWIAAAGTIIAAALIAADLGRRITGYGFGLFCAVASTWVVIGLTGDAMPSAAMNVILLAINAWGVWQFLLNPRKKREIELTERCAEKAHEQARVE